MDVLYSRRKLIKNMNYYDLQYHAKKQEQQNNWREAARLWKLAGCNQDYDACILIAESIEKGDQYRERVLYEAGPEPDKCENPRAWVKWYDTMASIYNKMFHQ